MNVYYYKTFNRKFKSILTVSNRVFTELGKTRRFHPTVSDEIRLIHENENEVIDAYINPELNE